MDLGIKGKTALVCAASKGLGRGCAEALAAAHPEALRSEVRFPPARPGHGMVGSGMVVLNPPFGLEVEAARLAALYAGL